MDEPEIWMMSGLVVNPGDTLVVSTSKDLSTRVANEWSDKIAAALPDVKVVVLSGVNDIIKIPTN